MLKEQIKRTSICMQFAVKKKLIVCFASLLHTSLRRKGIMLQKKKTQNISLKNKGRGGGSPIRKGRRCLLYLLGVKKAV